MSSLSLLIRFFKRRPYQVCGDGVERLDEKGGGRVYRVAAYYIREHTADARGGAPVEGTQKPSRKQHEDVARIEVAGSGQRNADKQRADATQRREEGGERNIFARESFFAFFSSVVLTGASFTGAFSPRAVIQSALLFACREDEKICFRPDGETFILRYIIGRNFSFVKRTAKIFRKKVI